MLVLVSIKARIRLIEVRPKIAGISLLGATGAVKLVVIVFVL